MFAPRTRATPPKPSSFKAENPRAKRCLTSSAPGRASARGLAAFNAGVAVGGGGSSGRAGAGAGVWVASACTGYARSDGSDDPGQPGLPGTAGLPGSAGRGAMAGAGAGAGGDAGGAGAAAGSGGEAPAPVCTPGALPGATPL